jgi:hypothetical protein
MVSNHQQLADFVITAEQQKVNGKNPVVPVIIKLYKTTEHDRKRNAKKKVYQQDQV